MDDYFDLGNYRRNITTTVDAAQTWFNRGLIWCYGFNQEEAVRCFTKVTELDPDCAMAYWGLAYAMGPFYNKPWEWYGEREREQTIRDCHNLVLQAVARQQQASAVEQALIAALHRKHPKPEAQNPMDTDNWMHDYANAMRQVHQQFDADLDVLCLHAEALMNLTPWKLWDLQHGVPANDAATLEVIDILESGLALVSNNKLAQHPGLLHFYIHVFEMSAVPETALIAANQLRNLCPDCGHLLHMASHIDGLCGLWQDAADANQRAIRADDAYIQLHNSNQFYLISVVHNHDFHIWASMLLGRFGDALDSADRICDLVRDKRNLGDLRYLGSTLDGYYAGRAHVLVRFGCWQQICDEAMPEDPDAVPITTIMLVYAKAIAHATLGEIDEARKFQQQFFDLYRQVPEWHIMANNRSLDILAVAQAMMIGEIEYHAGNHEIGFRYLREASVLSDHLEYAEPWPWMHPPRHALGALLLEQNRAAEAIIHYEDDLGIHNRLSRCLQHPNNIWSLHGYHECLQRLGRIPEAAAIKPDLDKMIRQSDIEIKSSCCCRKS